MIPSPLKAVRFAAQGFFDTLVAAQARLETSEKEYRDRVRDLEATRQRKDASSLEDFVAALRDEIPAEYNASTARNRLAWTRELLEESRNAAATAILQLAKHILVTAYGSAISIPGGRQIGTQPIREVISAGRNQAVHWEEGSLFPPTRRVFEKLAIEFGATFDVATGPPRNCAFECLRVMGWTTYEHFEADVLSLLT